MEYQNTTTSKTYRGDSKYLMKLLNEGMTLKKSPNGVRVKNPETKKFMTILTFAQYRSINSPFYIVKTSQQNFNDRLSIEDIVEQLK